MLPAAAARLFVNARRASTAAGVVVKPPRALRGRARPPPDDPRLPVVALVGRPNVGKSALFNALTRRKRALVRDTPAGHVTRDWTRGRATVGGVSFAAIDTSGLEPAAAGGSLAAVAADATAAALVGADAAVLLLDARAGIVPADAALAAWLRTRAPPALPIVPALTKADGVGAAALAAATGDGAGLGFGEPVAVSATTGSGLADLAAALAPVVDAAAARRQAEAEDAAAAAATADSDDPAGPIRVALVGAPNVGKSTLANALLGRARCLASPTPGTTRDAVVDGVLWRGRRLELVDTAGWEAAVARRGAAAFAPAAGATTAADEGDILASALAQTRRWLNLAHVVVLVTDAAAAAQRGARGPAAAAVAAALTRSELQLLAAAAAAGRAAVLVANKADLVPDAAAAAAALAAAAAARVPTLGAPTAVALSATTGAGLADLMPAVAATHTAWASRLPTAALNRWVRSLPQRGGRRGASVPAQLARVTYITQPSARPPSFVAFVKGDAGSVSGAARRALANALRREFGLDGVPVRVAVRGKQKVDTKS